MPESAGDSHSQDSGLEMIIFYQREEEVDKPFEHMQPRKETSKLNPQAEESKHVLH